MSPIADTTPATNELDTSAKTSVGVAAGQLTAWLVIAGIDAICIETMIPRPASGVRTRLLHHLYDAGHMLSLGLLASAVVEAWSRWGPRSPRIARVALWAVAAAVGALLLTEDFRGVAGRIPSPDALDTVVLVGLAAAVIPLAAILGRLAGSRLWSALPAGLAAVSVAFANQVVLQNDYPGIHLFLAWASATLLGRVLAELPVPLRPSPFRRRLLQASRATAAVAAAASLVVWPGSAVVIELFKLPGSIVAPVLVRLRSFREGEARILADAQEWFTDRSKLPAVPPGAPLLAKDAIVILFVVDCLRADLLDGKAKPAALPNMIALRDASIHFRRARAAATATTQSVTAIGTGRYYSQIEWAPRRTGSGDRVFPHQDRSVRFPELLTAAGVRTVIVTGLSGLAGDSGVLRGFSEEAIGSTLNTPSSDLVATTLERLQEVGDGRAFVYLHAADAHAPYDMAGKKGSPFDRYLRELGLVDKSLGELQAGLERAGLASRTTIILTADHGEAFGEHNDTFHSHTLYDELLRVPLLVHGPAVVPRKVDDLVSLIDLGPTLLDLFGQKTPGSFMGQSLVPYLRGDSPTLRRPIAAESTRWIRAMVTPDGFKVISDRRRGTLELYDLSKDPRETNNLLADEPPGSEPHAALLRAFFAAHQLKRPGYEPPYQP